MENKLEMIKKLALRKVIKSLGFLNSPNNMTYITFGDIKKVVCSNNYYEVVIDYKINKINNVSFVKVYESELLEINRKEINMSKKEILQQVELAISEVERLQSMLDNLYIEEDINIDTDEELTSLILILQCFEKDIKENDDIE
jgi:hypothetical protein